jgi:hypothetical protein
MICLILIFSFCLQMPAFTTSGFKTRSRGLFWPPDAGFETGPADDTPALTPTDAIASSLVAS